MIFTLLFHVCDLLIEVFDLLIFGPFYVSQFLRQHLLVRPQNLNLIFVGIQFLLELIIDFIHALKLRLLAPVQVLDVLLDLLKPIFILRKYCLLILVLRPQQRRFLLQTGQSLRSVLQLSLTLFQRLLQMMLPVHRNLLQFLLFLAELRIYLIELLFKRAELCLAQTWRRQI